MVKKDAQQSSDRQYSSSRRSVLKIAGATTSTALLSSVVGASQESPTTSERADRTQRQAIEIRNRTGSQARFKQFLSKNADYFESRQLSFTPKSMQPEDPSSQNWSDDAISTDLVLTYYYDSCTSGDPYAYFDYYVTVNSDHGSGEPGPDQMSISWPDHHYRYEQDSAYHDTDMDNLSLEKESLNGVDWEWKDGNACSWGLCGTKDYYVGCKAQLLTTDQERGVQASYWDMWEKAKVESITFTSSGGVAFTFTTEGRTDQYGFQIREDSDAYTGCW